MKYDNINKLKKYLFWISIFFFSLSFLHLFYGYVAHNSKTQPLVGGSISEGIVGPLPSLNPLKPLRGNNRYIIELLYRSLLRYDITEKKIVGDIANCDIGDMINIECVINDNAKWSNGESITAGDIVATYNLIKETNANPAIASSLEGVDIESSENVVVFKNKKEDINFLNIFFQPILNQEIINKLTSANIKGTFSTNGIYSGEYVLRDITTDKNIGVSKLVFEKNKEYGAANISKITMYVFPDANALERNKKSITVFNDTHNILGDSVARFKSNRYSLSQFVGLFINTEKIEYKNLRGTILNAINRDNLITLLDEKNVVAVNNPYFSKQNMDTEVKNKNFEAVMNSLGYRKKSQLLDGLQNKTVTESSNENGEESVTVEPEKQKQLPDRSQIDISRYQKDSEFILEPEYVDIYNFVTKDNILLKGTGTKDVVDEVYINDVKLKDFAAGDENFYFRLLKESKTIKEGKNSYKIYFVSKGEKLLKEEIHFLHYPDKDKLEKETEKLVDELYKQEQEANKPKPEVIGTDVEKNSKVSETNIDTNKLKEIESLDDKMYYSKDMKPFTLSLVYLDSRADFEKTAVFMQKSLLEIGVNVELKPLSNTGFITALRSSDYDIILGGIDTGYFGFNIFPYFHSSQVESGFNYGNIKRTSLDLLLEDLRSKYHPEKKNKLQEEVIKIFGEEQFFKTLYSPRYNLLIDKTIHSNIDLEKIPNPALRSKVIEQLYLKESLKLSLDGKSIPGFISYLVAKLYE